MASKKMRKPMDSASDDAERMMGAMALVRDKLGNYGFPDFTEYSSLKEAQDSVYDVLVEGDIGDYYPASVWGKASDDLIKKLWASWKKKGGEGPMRKRAYNPGDVGRAKQGQRR